MFTTRSRKETGMFSPSYKILELAKVLTFKSVFFFQASFLQTDNDHHDFSVTAVCSTV